MLNIKYDRYNDQTKILDCNIETTAFKLGNHSLVDINSEGYTFEGEFTQEELDDLIFEGVFEEGKPEKVLSLELEKTFFIADGISFYNSNGEKREKEMFSQLTRIIEDYFKKNDGCIVSIDYQLYRCEKMYQYYADVTYVKNKDTVQDETLVLG